ncbi:MAG TPA: flippase [Thermoanaerobacter sp.]|nr:MAG: polysaccharide biosynthesis protein [Thermoanaerobacter thermocopriae]HAA64160.1 flippase [Thermoanaerobacter sp.]
MVEKVLQNSNIKRLITNIFSLSLLQIANYVLPLLTVPYLVRVLGPEKYGLISFSQAFIQYFILLTDYGFNLSATRKISIYRDDKEKISEIFSAVFFIKICLLIISFLIIVFTVLFFRKFRLDFMVYFYTFGMVIGNVLFPVWFFQGMEEMNYITYLNIAWKTIFTVSIFIFVRNQTDYLNVPLLNSLGYVGIGLFSLCFINKKFKVKYVRVKFETVKNELVDGYYIFISTLATSLYTVSNSFILGLITNNTIVGYYSATEKIIRAVQGLNNPVSQAIYPYVSKLSYTNKDSTIKFIKKVIKYVGMGSLLVSICIFVLAKPIVFILLGYQYVESLPIMRILAFLPFLVALSNIFGIQIMLNFGMEKEFSRIIISASAINIVLAIILAYFYKHVGVSFSVLITEIYVTVIMYFTLRKKKIL